MDYKIITPPTKLPLDISDIQEFLRIDHNDDLETINMLIQAATTIAENYCNRSLITTEYQLFHDMFIDDLSLIRGPIIEVSEVKANNLDGSSEVLTDWMLSDTNGNGRVSPTLSDFWSVAAVVQRRRAVEITYTAGYGPNRVDIPKGMISALMLIVGFLYQHREGIEIPASLYMSLDPYKVEL